MSKIKDFYFEQISEGITENNDKFSDDDYQTRSHKQCTDKCIYGEDIFCPKVLEIMKERAMEQSFEFESDY